MCVRKLLSRVWLFVTAWTIACQLLCPSASGHGILQARILEWVAVPISMGSSQPRNHTQISHTAGRFFTNWAAREVNSRLVQRIWLSIWQLVRTAFLLIAVQCYQKMARCWTALTCPALFKHLFLNKWWQMYGMEYYLVVKIPIKHLTVKQMLENKMVCSVTVLLNLWKVAWKSENGFTKDSWYGSSCYYTISLFHAVS